MIEPTNNWIKKSWERSQSYDVDEFKAKDYLLGESAVKEVLEQNRLFLKETYPFIDRLSHWLKTNSSMVAVMNNSGYLLESSGDPEFLKVSQKLFIRKGSCWSEKVQGTNASGVVIEEKRPLAVVGNDYFLKKNRSLFGVAAPIFNPYGELQGIFDIIGYQINYHSSLLLAVDIISRSIEDQLLMNLPQKKIVVSLQTKQIEKNIGLLAIGEDGIILGMNREAREQFKIDTITNQKILLSELVTGSKQLLDRKSNLSSPIFTITSKKDSQNKYWNATVIMDTRPFVVSLSRESNAVSKLKNTKNIHYATYTFSDIYSNDKKMQEAISLAKRAATTDCTIMINGESGTGKEIFSQAIHKASPRSDYPFIAINCGAITKSLLESELFGYEAGAFTGARQSGHPGKFELANGGTLFLDEIAEMPPEMQIALLRVLQDLTIIRIGGTRPIKVDVRIIAASHKNLWEVVQEGGFRADLYYRLQGIHIKIPPFRERSDRLTLAKQLLRDLESKLQLDITKLSPKAESLIENYHWPGNVRQLIGALREASFLSNGDIIDIQHFPEYILNEYYYEKSKSKSLLERAENKKIIETLQSTQWNISKAARILGIGRNTLYRKLNKLDL